MNPAKNTSSDVCFFILCIMGLLTSKLWTGAVRRPVSAMPSKEIPTLCSVRRRTTLSRASCLTPRTRMMVAEAVHAEMLYVSWEAKNWSSSSSFHCIGHEFELNRQPRNDACYAFINTLQFPNDVDLYALFSFSIFENRNREGDKLTDGVVMDGTALGISGIPPKFCRSTSLVRPVPRSVSISA